MAASCPAWANSDAGYQFLGGFQHLGYPPIDRCHVPADIGRPQRQGQEGGSPEQESQACSPGKSRARRQGATNRSRINKAERRRIGRSWSPGHGQILMKILLR